jgi:hypothetical protein
VPAEPVPPPPTCAAQAKSGSKRTEQIETSGRRGPVMPDECPDPRSRAHGADESGTGNVASACRLGDMAALS